MHRPSEVKAAPVSHLMLPMDSRPEPNLELWGGVECTRNRVGDHFFDQISISGHDQRIDDLERIQALGIRTLRYPVLWEWAVPTVHSTNYNWTWADTRLTRLRRLGITPVAGLVHHGSGPLGTDLTRRSFPHALAEYAKQLARRHSWVAYYTPVNEPLTTARFSGLYGVWYPHSRNDLAFATMVLNQCRAVVLSMEAIRTVRPDAKLIQTEDFGVTYSTPHLAYQAEFDNARRWLTFDLLCGRVDAHHPIGHFFRWLGIPECDLNWFQDHPCPPQMVGINHYVTSNRFLDDRLDDYPSECHGGNGSDVYADVEAVRAMRQPPPELAQLLVEVWDRYHIPVAITEAHLGCVREEQMRWLWEIWQQAHRAREQGADVRAVTTWALFGSFDWDSLMTRMRGSYESGAFSVSGPEPRPTALAELVRQITVTGQARHPLLEQPGWWRRPERLRGHGDTVTHSTGQPVLISGGRGTLAQAFLRICQARSIPCQLLGRSELDIADRTSVSAALDRYRPWAVINAAGYVRVDDAESDVARCVRENVVGPVTLAHECGKRRLGLVTFSSDLVFDGARCQPYRETDAVNPLNVYGYTKAESERQVLQAYSEALVVRTSAFFGPWDRHNFVWNLLNDVSRGRHVTLTEYVISPTYVPDLVHSCLDLLIDRESGIWHVVNQGAIAWYELAQAAITLAQLSPTLVLNAAEPPTARIARRPTYSAMSSGRGMQLRSWTSALQAFFDDCTLDWAAPGDTQHPAFASHS